MKGNVQCVFYFATGVMMLMYVRFTRIARTMISSSPYNTWPLHVKFFTEEAQKAWKDAGKVVPDASLPPGFTTVLELEGVDGKSGHRGSGRTGAIQVADGESSTLYRSRLSRHNSLVIEQFTASHLKKSDKFSAAAPNCAICHDPIIDFKKVNTLPPSLLTTTT